MCGTSGACKVFPVIYWELRAKEALEKKTGLPVYRSVSIQNTAAKHILALFTSLLMVNKTFYNPASKATKLPWRKQLF